MCAGVLDVADGGFTIRETVTVAAPPDKAYAAMLDVAKWWSSEHTYSGNAANLSIDPRPSGCCCEKLRHMTVVYVAPGKAIRFEGGLGPLQSTGVTGSMTWEFDAREKRTAVELRYAVGGYSPDGLKKVASLVDGVLRAQVERFQRYVDTGKPWRSTPFHFSAAC